MKRLLIALVLATACQKATAVNATLKDIPVDITPVFPAAGEK